MFHIVKILAVIIFFPASQLIGQDTCSVNGIYINSLLVDPTGLLENYDTNGDGIPNSNDEFIEICNSSQDTIDIGGWQINDDDPPPGADFVFPDSSMIAPGGCLLLVANYCPVDSIFCEPPSGVIDMGLEFLGLLANGGDLVMLSDTTGLNCAVTYGNYSCEDVDPLDAPGFNSGDCEYWDTDVDGCPLLMIGDSCGYVPQPLPLGLLNFNAYPKANGAVTLEWTVEESLWPDTFIIEWKSELSGENLILTRIASKQESSDKEQYSYTHIGAKKGLNYYRIKAVKGGRLKWLSEFRVVNLDIKNKISVYPNPVVDRLFITGTSDIKELKIFNLSGELIDKNIPETNFEFLDLVSLREGIYVLQVFDGTQFSNIKFVKI